MEQIFKENPSLDVAYKTADDKFFYTENGAHNHASELEDKKVEIIYPDLEGADDSSAVTKDSQNLSVTDIEENAATDTLDNNKPKN